MTKFFSFKKEIRLNRLNPSLPKHYGWALQILTVKPLNEKHVTDLNNYIKRKIKSSSEDIKLRFINNSVLTKKPIESRMGGGKSPIKSYRYCALTGTILVEFYNISFENIYLLSRNLKNKLPCKVRLIRVNE